MILRLSINEITSDQLDALLMRLERTDAYLAATHLHAARHDVFGENYACAGCELLAEIRTPLPPHDREFAETGTETHRRTCPVPPSPRAIDADTGHPGSPRPHRLSETPRRSELP